MSRGLSFRWEGKPKFRVVFHFGGHLGGWQQNAPIWAQFWVVLMPFWMSNGSEHWCDPFSPGCSLPDTVLDEDILKSTGIPRIISNVRRSCLYPPPPFNIPVAPYTFLISSLLFLHFPPKISPLGPYHPMHLLFLLHVRAHREFFDFLLYDMRLQSEIFEEMFISVRGESPNFVQ